MTEHETDNLFSAAAPVHGSNDPAYSVSEISGRLKCVVEDQFSHVRVRGEISGYKRAASGHVYLTLKDDKAVLDGVCWRSVAARLNFKPEDGMEVICTGKLTTYAGRSKYQIVIERMEPAGIGALLAQLERRRKALAAEGLFDAARKRPLPYLPRVIGVVTSPTGAVIRDILHRLSDRFPRHVLLYPVPVQGEGAAEKIAMAIHAFNRLKPADPVPRPDLIIVARGGGSLEDLWAFNEEIVVRAAADSHIPLISAVGHETDTTLIDYAADRRAPTPTAAAEIAVPVRGELIARLKELDQRLYQAMRARHGRYRERLEGIARGLRDPRLRLMQLSQRLDDLDAMLRRFFLNGAERARQRLDNMAARLSSRPLLMNIGRQRQRLDLAAAALEREMARSLRTAGERLGGLERLLEGYSYRSTLKRGFTVIWQDGRAVPRQAALAADHPLEIEFADGLQRARPVGRGGDAEGARTEKKAQRTPRRAKKTAGDGEGSQGSLF